MYYSNFTGCRLKDDNNKFCCIDYWRIFNYQNKNVHIFEYADGIFTTGKSLEEYEIKTAGEKYNL